MLDEFKKFIMRGNLVDLAVGVIIGLAFGAIVSSLVGDIIMPVIGAITGGLDFTNYYTPLSSKVELGLAYVEQKARCSAWLGSIPNRRLEFPYHRRGFVLGHQRNQQTKKGSAGNARRTNTRGKAPHRYSRFAKE